MSLKVEPDGTITVRAPWHMPVREADLFVENHREWISKRLKEYERIQKIKPVYTEEEKKAGRERARGILSEKCRIYAEKMGVSYQRITVREQKTRWGSCSARGNLNFNWKLVLMPEEIQDYLVVHELAHRIEMNHSPAFWVVVEKELPDYRARREWLKKNGANY